MLRLIAFLLYMGGYLIYSMPQLSKLKKITKNMSVDERDKRIHEIPQRWSRQIMEITGSDIELVGKELIPEGPVLFTSNHEGDFDIPVLLSSIDKPFGFISKIEIKKVPLISTWMEAINCVFLDRKNRKAAVRSIMSGAELLKKGHSLVIFPEGTRSKGGPVGLFKAGGFRLAYESHVPIVPVSIEGTSAVFEKNGRLIKPAKIKVTICQPLFYQEYKDKDSIKLAGEVREMIINSRKEKKIAS